MGHDSMQAAIGYHHATAAADARIAAGLEKALHVDAGQMDEDGQGGDDGDDGATGALTPAG